ncbi:uncharacterized protein YegL [Methylohalomonas lacus]|uniref:Uncharacterized protein YegL n=1 Tax=Methylohalomonas lacus TaxID=398773 RepID=A0AAE3L1X7_9GAMM|nr:VWA domain-containing protein [Methylohalomonas lacus]MCS3903656.1 uncharacterized protein YegL [Methylohalomonas lacus]
MSPIRQLCSRRFIVGYRRALVCMLALLAVPAWITAGADTQAPPARDVVLVLDNSGSMRDNDPQSLVPATVQQFVAELDADDRVALLVFDQDVELVQDFVRIEAGREQLLTALPAIDYSGQYTDSPAAIERALYMLKNQGRADARRLIVFMTDGIVDTGDVARDAASRDWLLDDLAADAARADIRIFAVAFTNDADFQLIQSLASKTEGDYFRALTAADLGAVFKRINDSLAAAPAAEAQPAPAPEPMIIEVPVEVPAQAPDYSAEERQRTLILSIAATVLCLTLFAILVVLVRRSRADVRPASGNNARALLYDSQGLTGQPVYELGARPTMLGRVDGGDGLDYIVVPETTVGRRHALIEYKDYAFWIVDQNSINGTYVNDRLVTSEMRLKHGDRIRLHKIEFEFAMPDMDDSGMTVVSNTVYERNGMQTQASADGAAASHFDGADLFDVSGGSEVNNDDSTPSAGRITLTEGDYNDAAEVTLLRPSTADADDGADDDDATLAPGMDGTDDDTNGETGNRGDAYRRH